MSIATIEPRMIGLAAILLVAMHAGPTDAQTSTQPMPPAQPLPAPGVSGPIVSGRDIQPRSNDGPGSQVDPEATELLRQTDDAGPVVPPHDLYGNPLGVTSDKGLSNSGKADPATTDPSKQHVNQAPRP